MYDYMYLMKIFGLLFIYVGSPTCKFFVSPSSTPQPPGSTVGQ